MTMMMMMKMTIILDMIQNNNDVVSVASDDASRHRSTEAPAVQVAGAGK